jgi:2-oxoglutarate ferredoxin oxidoreductase subunit alpha
LWGRKARSSSSSSSSSLIKHLIHTDPLIFRVEGEGGRGGSVVGEILARSAARLGYNIQCSRAFPAEIKGGRAWFQFKISSQPQTWWGGTPDIEMTDTRHGDWVISIREPDGTVVKAPLAALSIAKSLEQPRSANLVALGFLAASLGLDRTAVLEVAHKRLSRRGEQSQILFAPIEAGYDQAESASDWPSWNSESFHDGRRRLILNGNEAIALGALAAGVRYFCGYPITPASSILETMLRELPKLGGTAIQMEDEIAALAACLGASYAGKKAMAATSGPGFALMSELMNLATVAELPITIVDVQRSGPATGQPTKSEQADLLYAIHGSPGDSPRIVLAPSNVEEAFYLSIEAVNLAEKYQMPVILLSDGALSNRIEAIPEPEWDSLALVNRDRVTADLLPEYERFMLTPTGVSAAAIPGFDDLPHIAGGMEHSSLGLPSGTSDDHYAMSGKRLRKLHNAGLEFERVDIADNNVNEAAIGIIGWGSTWGSITEAVGRLRAEGFPVKQAHLKFLNPLPELKIAEWMSFLDVVVVAEENRSGQLAGLIKHLAPQRVVSLIPDDDFELTPEAVVNFVKDQMHHVRIALAN